MSPNRPVVVDTNVVVAGLLTADASSATARILDGMLEVRFPYVLSVDLLAEYRRVLLRPKLRRLHGLGPGDVDDLLTALTVEAVLRDPPSIQGPPAPDPGDDHLWALLEAVPDAILVTGDALLLSNPPEGRSVLSPRSFIDAFQGR